jgi:hypothetical protein
MQVGDVLSSAGYMMYTRGSKKDGIVLIFIYVNCVRKPN